MQADRAAKVRIGAEWSTLACACVDGIRLGEKYVCDVRGGRLGRGRMLGCVFSMGSRGGRGGVGRTKKGEKGIRIRSLIYISTDRRATSPRAFLLAFHDLHERPIDGPRKSPSPK